MYALISVEFIIIVSEQALFELSNVFLESLTKLILSMLVFHTPVLKSF